MEKTKNTNKIYTNMIFVTVAALLCCALWGSATPFIKIGYKLILPTQGHVPSIMLFAGLRFVIAGLLTVLIYSVARRKFLVPAKSNIGKVVTVSCFQTVIQYIFFYVGLANTSGAKGTIISGSDVFFSLVLASLIFKQEKLTLRKIVACVIGFAGIVVVNLNSLGNGLDLNMNFFGDAFVLFAAISYSVSSVLMKAFSKYEDPVVISGYQFIIGGIFMTIVGFAFGGKVQFGSFEAVAVFIYLAFLSAIAYALWGILLKHNPVSRVSVFSFTKPVFGVILTYLMLNEDAGVSITNLVVALILVCAGIVLLNYKKDK